MNTLLFQEAHPTRAQIVAEARLYLGLPFEMKHPKIVWQDGNPVGKTHCVHLLFTIAQRLGYLPLEWDYKRFAAQARFSPGMSGLRGSLEARMHEALEANCDLVWKRENPRDEPIRSIGDIMLIRHDWRGALSAHHVAIAMPGNKVLHAIDYIERGACKVMEEDFWIVQSDIVEIWRLRGVIDG